MILIFCILIVYSFQSRYTLTIVEGDQYETPTAPFYEKNQEVMQINIRVSYSAATYLLPNSDEVQRCMSSWNKLWGYSRCFGSLHHKDSDRFVFRRVQSCLKYNEKGVYEDPNCQENNLIEIAAYAYDNSVIPYEHPDQLIRVFQTKIQPEIFYSYRLTFLDTSTIYELLDMSGNILETQTIQHRTCYAHKNGYRLNLYFGGICTAPVDISADHIEVINNIN